MKNLKKLAAAAALVMAISTLTACGEQKNAALQSTAPQSTTTESKPAPQSSAPVSSSAPEQSAPPTTSLPDGFPENPSEESLKYYESAVGIVDNYLSIVMGNYDEAERVGLWELDYDDPQDQKKIKQVFIEWSKKGEGYLDELEQLTPTDEMSAFHNELVSLMNTLRGYTVIANSLDDIDLTDENAQDRFNAQYDRLFEQFNKQYRAFYVKYPDFGKELAQGEWQENGSSMADLFMSDLGELAIQGAKNVSNAITYGLSVQEDKPSLENAVIDIIRTKNGCEITGAALSDKNIEGIEYYLNILIPAEYEFWARAYLREDGSSRFVLFSFDGKLDDSELNGGAGLESNLREWRDTGVTSGGHIIGTFGAPPTSEPQ